MISPQKHKKDNRFSDLNITASFNNNTVSSTPCYTYVEAFKEMIEFESLIKDTMEYQKPSNSTYSVSNIIEYMLDAIILGCSKFSHMDDLREDPAYQKIKSFKLSSEKVSRDLLKFLPKEAIVDIRLLNKKLLAI